MIFVAQEQAIRTNLIKKKIDKSQEQTKCRMCNRTDETINHIVSECPKLAQREYKRRHDWVGRRIHWEICRANGIYVISKWYEHQPEAVIENSLCKILWGFTAQTDHFITSRRSDMICIDKKHHEYQIIDFAIPCDTRVDDKEVEKIEKHLDLARELKKVWNMKVIVVPLVVGALGTAAKEIEKRLKTISIETKITELQKTVLIHTSRVLQKFTEVRGVLLTPYLKKYNISVGRNQQTIIQ